MLPPCSRDPNLWTWAGHVNESGWTIDFFFSPPRTFRADHPIFEWCAERQIVVERYNDILSRVEFMAEGLTENQTMEFKLAWC